MKIALIGYGKMGKLVETKALARGHDIVAVISPRCERTTISKDHLADCDLCIDFSHPEHVLNNIRQVAALKKNMVVGTTGWYEHLNDVRDIVKESGIGLFYSPNFSLGIALFLEIVAQAAAMIDPLGVYDVGGHEIHHRTKSDSPSGTSLLIGQKLLEKMQHKKNLIFDRPQSAVNAEDIHFSSSRIGTMTGTHTIIFDSPVDSITLTHQAKNRDGFAEGAVRAAEWVEGRTGLFTLEEMLSNIFPKENSHFAL